MILKSRDTSVAPDVRPWYTSLLLTIVVNSAVLLCSSFGGELIVYGRSEYNYCE